MTHKTASKSVALPLIFISSAMVFIGAMIFTHHSLPVQYTQNNIKNISYQSQNGSWGAKFVKKEGILVIKEMKQNSFAKSIGLKNGDKILRINEVNNPSYKEMEKALENRNKIINLVVQRGENLYNIKALPY
ncbi:MAG: hypothetical protein GXO31_04455 [Epsilonproteobacteria bacterium]|nr:hypothetical protein [Campylobacterota bacterium]